MRREGTSPPDIDAHPPGRGARFSSGGGGLTALSICMRVTQHATRDATRHARNMTL